MTVAGQTQAEIAHAARQAWVGFWASCMAGTGSKSLLTFDEETAMLEPPPKNSMDQAQLGEWLADKMGAPGKINAA